MACADFRRTYACWRWNGARQKRPMNSIVLEPSVKEMLLADCRDFLRSEDWYVYYLEFIGIRREHLVCRYAERGGFIKRCARKRTCTYSPVSVRDTLPPWLPFAWCAREVRSCPERDSCVDVTPKAARLRSFIRSLANLDWTYMLSVSHPRGAYSALPLIPRLISGNRMSDNTLTTLMGNVPSRWVDSPKVMKGLCGSQMP
jgi:hypothetical protein